MNLPPSASAGIATLLHNLSLGIQAESHSCPTLKWEHLTTTAA
jgi:hypothetical protein